MILFFKKQKPATQLSSGQPLYNSTAITRLNNSTITHPSLRLRNRLFQIINRRNDAHEGGLRYFIYVFGYRVFSYRQHLVGCFGGERAALLFVIAL